MTTPQDPVPMLVITGGPCAGKSTVMRLLELLYGDVVELVPEAATQIRDEGFPDPPEDPVVRAAWMEEIQVAITTRILKLEAEAQQRAADLGKQLLIADRGLADGFGYHPGGANAVVQLEPFVQHKLIHPKKVVNRYEAVIHLESLAVHHAELYQTQNNTARYESVEQAKAADQAVAYAWHSHHNWKLICNEHLDLQGVNNAVLAEVQAVLRSITQRRQAHRISGRRP